MSTLTRTSALTPTLTLLFLLLCIMTKAEIANTQKDLMDFWLGDWNCAWGDSVQATNHISRILDNKVIEENFHYSDGTFIGKSWSMFDSTTSKWRQTWVDNAGAYLVFTGRKEGDTVIFEGDESVTKNGQKNYRRMIFFSIKKDSFEWDWQSSADRHKWKSLWHISYTRK